jgi:hypothetical protein
MDLRDLGPSQDLARNIILFSHGGAIGVDVVVGETSR